MRIETIISDSDSMPNVSPRNDPKKVLSLFASEGSAASLWECTEGAARW